MHVYSVNVSLELEHLGDFVCNKEARSAPTSTSLRHSTPSGAAIMLTVTYGSDEGTHMQQCYAELEWRRSFVVWHLATKQLRLTIACRKACLMVRLHCVLSWLGFACSVRCGRNSRRNCATKWLSLGYVVDACGRSCHIICPSELVQLAKIKQGRDKLCGAWCLKPLHANLRWRENIFFVGTLSPGGGCGGRCCIFYIVFGGGSVEGGNAFACASRGVILPARLSARMLRG